MMMQNLINELLNTDILKIDARIKYHSEELLRLKARIVITYRAKNSFGAYELETRAFEIAVNGRQYNITANEKIQ